MVPFVSPQTNTEEMTSDKVSIDLSEFLQYPYEVRDSEIALKSIREHLQQLGCCTEIEEVKLLNPTNFYLPGDEKQHLNTFSRFYTPWFITTFPLQMHVDALKAIFPKEGQQHTIERVELLISTKCSIPAEVEGPRLTVNNLCLYRYSHSPSIHEISVQKDELDTLLHTLQNLGVDVHHIVIVCVYHPGSYPPEAKDIHIPEGVKVEHKTHNLLEENHISYITATSRQLSYLTYKAAINCISKLINYLFMQQLNLNRIHKEKSKGGGVAIAVLASGYDYNTSSKWNIVDRYNSNSQYSPVHESYGGVGSILTDILSQIAPESKLIACRTSFDRLRHLLPNGATSRALNWLRGKWKARQWGEDVHSLVVLIPYGGHYREDEMRAINDAIDNGIIVVCAAGSTIPQSHGDHVPGIAFPGSMGNVLCIGAMDDQNEPAFDSPSGREVDCIALGSHGSHYSDWVVAGTGISAAILSGMVALIMSYIKSSLGDMPRGCPEYNHVSIIREVLQQTTTSTKHHPHSGYGLLTHRIFSFSKRQLEKLLNSITQERSFRTIPGSASEVTEQCKFNSDILSNRALNSELQLPISLDGGGIRVAVIDDDFPEILKASYKAKDLETEMRSWDKCTPSMSEKAELLLETSESLKKLVCDLRARVNFVAEEVDTLEKKVDSIESEINLMSDEICFKYTPIKDSHGLQCALVVANIVPEAELLLVNIPRDSASQGLATMIENLVERPKRPDVIVCSLGFDQFNLRLSQAISKVINAGIIPVFSAGNIGQTGSNTISYPSRLGNVLCIGAHTWHGTSHSFSSVGREIDFLAPGEFMVLDKYPVSGTSFSAPAVAAFIALILHYVDQVVGGEWTLRPIDARYKSIDAWSEEPPDSDKWGWHDVPLNKACRNVYVMRELLRQMSVHRTEHSDSAGYGNLDIRRLLKDLEPEDIHSIVQNFHKHSK